MTNNCNETNKIIKSVKDDKNELIINLCEGYSSEGRLLCWINLQDVKLLVLDGQLGGKNGMEYIQLSSDAEVCDNWHLGKKYDAQSYVRVWTILNKDENGRVSLEIAGGRDYNSCLAVSKRTIRNLSKNLIRAKSEVIEEIGMEMINNFIKDFNVITNGEVYSLNFYCTEGDDIKYAAVEEVFGNVDKEIVMAKMSPTSFFLTTKKEETEKLLEKLSEITQLSNN